MHPPLPPRGLRERKRIETRQRIADVATLLFLERGFDAVTVADVAAAADVSKVTVFNYFPRKEDLLLDRMPEADILLTEAVENRRPDQTPLAAVRELLVELFRTGHPFAGIGPGREHFWRVVQESPTLRARVREAVEELEARLAALFLAAGGAVPGGADARLAAALVVTAYRTVHAEGIRHQLSGIPSADLVDDHLARLEDAFDRVERAVSGPQAGSF